MLVVVVAVAGTVLLFALVGSLAVLNSTSGPSRSVPVDPGLVIAHDTVAPPRVDATIVFATVPRTLSRPAWTLDLPTRRPGATYDDSPYFWSGPTLVDGVVVTESGAAALGVDPKTGLRLWETPLPNDDRKTLFLGREPIAAGGEALIDAGDSVFALDARSGAIRWRRTKGTNDRVFATADSVVVLSPRDVTALDAMSGVERWTAGIPAVPSRGGALSGTNLVIVTASGPTAIDLGTGKRVWAADVPGLDLVNVAASLRALVALAADGTVLGFDPATGAERWRTKVGGPRVGLHVGPRLVGVDGERAYLFTGENDLAALAVSTGSVLWLTTVVLADPFAKWSSVSGTRLAGTTKEGPVVLDGTTGSPIARFELFVDDPVQLVDSRLFVVTMPTDGKGVRLALVAIDLP